MKTINFISLLLLACLFYQCKTIHYGNSSRLDKTNYSSKPSHLKPGECYAKCLMPDQLEIYSDEYPVYIGNDLEEDVEVVIKKIELSPATTKWIKKKADRNCVSANPDDCLVWCLVEVPAETKELKILVDTTQSSNYELIKIDKKNIVEKGEYVEWKRVLCGDNITRQVIGKIQSALKISGYYQEENSFKLDRKTKTSLKKFQQENNLPMGQLDYETLDALGVVVN